MSLKKTLHHTAKAASGAIGALVLGLFALVSGMTALSSYLGGNTITAVISGVVFLLLMVGVVALLNYRDKHSSRARR